MKLGWILLREEQPKETDPVELNTYHYNVCGSTYFVYIFQHRQIVKIYRANFPSITFHPSYSFSCLCITFVLMKLYTKETSWQFSKYRLAIWPIPVGEIQKCPFNRKSPSSL